jgi:hypothetical protein
MASEQPGFRRWEHTGSLSTGGTQPLERSKVQVEGMMRQMRVLTGIAGLMLVALAAYADEVPKQVKILGQTYNVVHNTRAGTFKNGVTIKLQAGGISLQKANLNFVPGADESADRMFVAAPVGQNGDDDTTGDQLYLMTGSDANGVFSAATSNATQYLGGAVDRVTGGRPNAVGWVSDSNALGVKKDPNLGVFDLADADKLRFYDFDSLAGGDYISNAVLEIQQPEEDETVADPGMPDGDLEAMANAGNGVLVVAGLAVADDNGDRVPEIGVIDPTKGKFYQVKTNLITATKDAAMQIDPTTDTPAALARIGDTNEYLMMTSQDVGGDDDTTSSETLYRLRITLPDNLDATRDKDASNTIKVDVLGKEDLLAAGLKPSDGGMFGMTVGREVSSGGPHRLYFADWHGEIYTLTPVP